MSFKHSRPYNQVGMHKLCNTSNLLRGQHNEATSRSLAQVQGHICAFQFFSKTSAFLKNLYTLPTKFAFIPFVGLIYGDQHNSILKVIDSNQRSHKCISIFVRMTAFFRTLKHAKPLQYHQNLPFCSNSSHPYTLDFKYKVSIQ